MINRLIVTTILLFSLSVAAMAQSLLRGPYLQLPTETSMTIQWRTDQSAVGTVKVGTDPANLTETFTESTSATDHSVRVTGLQPGTRYYYSVSINNNVLAGGDSLHTFKTNPPQGSTEPIRIWAIGDFGKGNQEQYQVRDSWTNYTGARGTDVWLWLGDNAYNDGTDQEYQTKVFDVYDTMFRYMPFSPCPGNHDYNSVSPITGSINPLDTVNHTGPYYDIVSVPRYGEAGGVASGYEYYYSFNYGNVHFISLNSELGSVTNQSHDWTGAHPLGGFNGSPMTQWLEQDLQQNTQPWVIVYFHQPPYSKGSHDSDDIWELYMQAMRENFTPIFDQYGVDLVINGHSHVYERSYPIKGHTGDTGDWDPQQNLVSSLSGYEAGDGAYVKYNHKPKANSGTIYAVVGCSASKDSDPELNHPAMHTGAGGDTTVGSMFIDVTGNRLDACFIRRDGKILDHFTVLKQDTAVVNDTTSDSTGTWIPTMEQLYRLNIYPNPFQKSITVAYELKTLTDVSLKMYNVAGETVHEIPFHTQSPGVHQLKIDGDKLALPEGIYFLDLSIGGSSTIKKAIKL